MIDAETAELLEREAKTINSPDFINDDPVQFPRRFTDVRDVEITALLVSSIAWGNRKMILRNSERLLKSMDYQPYNYVRDKGYEELAPHENIHRTFFTDNLKHYLRGLYKIYERHNSLDEFTKKIHAGETEHPAWELAKAMNLIFKEANEGRNDCRCLPLDTDKTALKRLNMALRWLVRDDGIVDLGIWKSIKPSQLFIPLDVHVGNISRDLGLLERRSNDKKAVVELTNLLKTLRPEDPTYYDFALFGIGVNGRRIGS